MDNLYYIILTLVFGFVLLAIEVFVAPGFTVFGIFGLILLSLGVILAFSNLPFLYAILVLILSLLAVSVFTIWFFKVGLKKRFTLKSRETGYRPYQKDYDKYVGKIGISLTPLRPSGTIMVNNDKISAVSRGEFIEAKAEIKVLKVEGNKVVVDKI
jgi:membrane-bound serine protease (ClpP class)